MKKASFVILFVLSLMSSANAQWNWLSKQMYTFDPRVQIYGPVEGTMSATEYRTQILRIILEEADDLAKQYREAEDHQAYWAFLVGALTIPEHEGVNLHFRKKASSASCIANANSGKMLSKSERYSGVFKRIFKSGEFPVLPNCEDIADDTPVHQTLFGADASDLGIMQINLYWHEKNFLAAGSWSSVRKSIRYGLNMYRQGFNSLYRNAKKYTCILNEDETINYESLIRGAWAGSYNSGNLASSCRFTNSESSWAKNDINFRNSLNKILGYDKKETRNNHFQVKDEEGQILEKVITGFKVGSEESRVVNDFLANSAKVNLDLGQPVATNSNKVKKEETPDIVEKDPAKRIEEEFDSLRIYKTTASALNVRIGANSNEKRCGLLPFGLEVTVQAQKGDWLEILRDDAVENYLYSDSSCVGQNIYAHKDYLVDTGKRIGVSEEEEPASVLSGIILKDLAVRSEAPEGCGFSSLSGENLDAGSEVIIVESVKPCKNSSGMWHRINAPVLGWINSESVKILEE